MKAIFARGSLLLLAAALAGCASTGGAGSSAVDVTRFHLNQPVARGQIAVETLAPPGAAGPEFALYRAAVERQLANLGWTVVQTVGQSEQVALIGLSQSDYVAPPRRGPVTVGVGGGTGGWGSGVGAGVGFNLGGGGSGPMTATTLNVRIQRRSDATVFWEGRATAQARLDRPEGQPAVVAERLSEALFRDFPGESGHTIRVK